MDLQYILALNVMVISGLVLVGAVLQGTWRNDILWLAVNGLIVVTGAVMLQWMPNAAGIAVTALFVALVLAPTVFLRLAQSRLYQRRIPEAARFAQLAWWVHPTRQTRLNAEMIQAQTGSTVGEQVAAFRSLSERATPHERPLLTVMEMRLQGRWDEVLAHLDRHPGLERTMAGLRIRGLGETGQVDQMARAYDDAKVRLHGSNLLEAQLFLLAFSGRASEAARLLDGPLSALDGESKAYWTAVAARAAGAAPESWQPQLAHLAHSAQIPSVRHAADRMLSTSPATGLAVKPVRLDDVSTVIVQDCAARLQQSAPPKEHAIRATPVTWLLVAAVGAVYLLSESQGGSENLRTLVDLGALWPPYVTVRGEWWRLGTALFLHFGPIHASINGVMLVLLGRACERMFGSLRLVVIYGLGGLASSAFVLWLAVARVSEPTVLVGASGAIMALFGALVGRNIVTWLRYRDVLDGRNLVMVMVIVLVQVAVDLATPQVSLAAHASGFVAGALIGVVMTVLQAPEGGRMA